MACGGAEPVNIEGTITSVSGHECSEVPAEESGEGLQVTVRDEDGSVIGTGTTRAGQTIEGNQGGCIVEAAYDVEVEEAEFYTFIVEGTAGESDPVSHQKLEELNFTYDLEAF